MRPEGCNNNNNNNNNNNVKYFLLHFNFGYAQMCFTILRRERNISHQTNQQSHLADVSFLLTKSSEVGFGMLIRTTQGVINIDLKELLV